MFLLNVLDWITGRINRAYNKKLLSNSNVSIGNGFDFNFQKSSFEISSNATVRFGESVKFRDFCSVLVIENSTLELGNLVFFNRYCSINCLGKIIIGDFTIFGEGVKLYDHNHQYKDISKIIQKEYCTIGEISIGSNCWIGSNVIILSNVSIGDNVVIGANNLIYKDIPSNTIVKSKVEKVIESRK